MRYYNTATMTSYIVRYAILASKTSFRGSLEGVIGSEEEINVPQMELHGSLCEETALALKTNLLADSSFFFLTMCDRVFYEIVLPPFK